MEKSSFSNNNSLALKGIAIIMMMYHHCFRTTQLFEKFEVSFFPFSQSLIVDISDMLKICVSIFVFITGYGLTISLKKSFKDYEWNKSQITKWIINRLIKLLSGFWFAAILSYIVCEIINGKTSRTFFNDGFTLGVINVIVNLLGLSKFFDTPNYASWWYMTIAVLYVLTLPLFLKVFKKYSYIAVLLGVIIFPRVLDWEYENSSYISFLFVLLLGAIFAENNLMVKLANIKILNNKIANKIIKFFIETALLVAFLKICLVLPVSKFWEIRYGVFPVLIILYLYEYVVDIPLINKILQYLGKHSLNIFLIHQFIRTNYLNNFIYSFKHFIIIGIVLLVTSLIVSILIELLKKCLKYDLLINKLQNKVSCVLDKLN